jgi:hypothetical protein
MHLIFNSPHEHGNVVFNFTRRPIDDLIAFALGYSKAGHELAAQFAAGRGYGDYEGYPILYLYRHALELYLKAVVYRGAKLLKLVTQESVNTDHLFQRHDLARWLPAIQAISKQMKWNFDGSGLASWEGFASFLHKLDSIDAGSYAFRYPINRIGEAQLPPHFVVNVVLFAEQMDGILQLLDGAAAQIDEHWEAEVETRCELERLAPDL